MGKIRHLLKVLVPPDDIRVIMVRSLDDIKLFRLICCLIEFLAELKRNDVVMAAMHKQQGYVNASDFVDGIQSSLKDKMDGEERICDFGNIFS